MLIRLARRSMILPTDRLWKATKQAQSFPEIRGKNIPGSILTGMYLSFRSSGVYEMFIGQAWQASLSNSFPAKAASVFWRASRQCASTTFSTYCTCGTCEPGTLGFGPKLRSLKDFKTESVDIFGRGNSYLEPWQKHVQNGNELQDVLSWNRETKLQVAQFPPPPPLNTPS